MTIKQAHTITIGCCGSCGRVHIMLFDEDETPFAEAAISRTALPDVMEDMKKAAYQAAVENDPDYRDG